MAARKNYRFKLKYAARLRHLSELTAEESRNTKELVMASASDQMNHSPARSPAEPLTAFNFANPSNSLPSQHLLSHPTALTTSMTTQRRRKASKNGISSLKRSVSTPNVRGDAGMSMADKRRNKLGYHRTSVACGHCRRRKIRCLLAPDDAQHRCSNCIRLKKECNFFPVDQQPQIERRPRTTSRAGTGEISNSSSSSPAMGSGNFDAIDHFSQYPPLPLTSQDFPASTASMNGNVLSPASRASINHRVFEYTHPSDRSHWDSPFFDHAPLSAGRLTPEDPGQAYWKLAESPITPGFSSHFSAPPSSVPHHARDSITSFSSLPPPRDEPGWSIHPRSSSFGHSDDVSANYQSQYHSPLHMDFRRRASDMHPPSLQTSGNSSNTSVSEAQSTPPLSAPPATSQPMHQYGISPTWHPISGHALMGKGPEYNEWYSDPVPLAKVQEEEAAAHYGGEHAIIYATNGHH